MISVVVCTRNRAASLRRTLESLAAMALPQELAWELIVVDNGSSDETRAVIEEITRTESLPLRYVVEPVPGLAHARNRGVREAHGDLLAFTDDDVVVDSRWLAEINREFSLKPVLGMVTGQTLMPADGRPDLAMRSVATQETHRFPANPRHVGGGNNIAIRASVLNDVGLFDVRLGPGRTSWGGEDWDLMYRVLRSGYTILSTPGSIVFHLHDRTAEPAARARRLLYVRGWGAVLCKHALQGDRWMARLFISEVRRLCRLAVRRGHRDRLWTLRRLMAMLGGAIRWLPFDVRERLERRA